MGRWRGWAPLAACVVAAWAARAGAAELSGLKVEAARDGARARLLLSEPVRATVRDVPGTPGTVLRLYVDLPRGTRVKPQVRGTAAAAPPIVGVGVGASEGGGVRIVLRLDGAATYHVERDRGGRVITLAVSPADGAAAGAPAAADPRAYPPPAARPRPALLGPKIVIDPGHGGNDPGAQGFTVEKDVTLAVATRLSTLLRERLGAEVVLTRAGDETLALSERTARANAEDADLFLSIHANASPRRTKSGIETYYLNNTNDRATIRLAAMENQAVWPARGGGGTDLRYILSDLVQVGKMEESITLATAVQRGLVGHLRRRHKGIADLGVKRGPFYVLVGAHMPCVLVETSFVTHPTEGRRLAGHKYRHDVAEGIFAGIARFLEDSRRARTL